VNIEIPLDDAKVVKFDWATKNIPLLLFVGNLLTVKINIVGITASGKSTFGRELAEAIEVPFIEMDSLFWGPNWREPPDTEFFENLEAALLPSAWVLDGNYSRTTHIKWKDVDTVIWLDYSFPKTFYRSVSRAIKRAYFKTELWPNTGNYETFSKLFSKESIVWWCIKSYSKIRKRYLKIMSDPEYAHIQFVHLKSPQQAEEYIQSMKFVDQASK